jgi:tetratricopeptide (TPR) repeat protein
MEQMDCLLKRYKNPNLFVKDIKYSEQLLSIYKKHYKSNDIKFGLIYNHIGWLYNEQKNNEKAIYYLELALPICIKDFGSDDLVIGRIYKILGCLYNKQKNNEKAIYYLELALSIFIKHYISYDKEIGNIYNYLGFSYKNQKNYEKAVQYLELVLPILKKHLQPDKIYKITNKIQEIKQIQNKEKVNEVAPEDKIKQLEEQLAIQQQQLALKDEQLEKEKQDNNLKRMIIEVKKEKVDELDGQVQDVTGGYGYKVHKRFKTVHTEKTNEDVSKECSICFREDGEHESYCSHK